jgi:hypothetical protein
MIKLKRLASNSRGQTNVLQFRFLGSPRDG